MRTTFRFINSTTKFATQPNMPKRGNFLQLRTLQSLHRHNAYKATFPTSKILLVTFFLFLIFLFLSYPKPDLAYAQSATPTPTSILTTPSPPPADLELRIDQIESQQAITIETLMSINDFNRFLFSVTGGIVALLVGIQGFVTYSQLKREGKRDLAELAGVKQISEIMTVVQQTLESRLAAEEEARKKAKEAEEKLADVAKKFERLDVFYQNFQSNIKKIRAELENDALQWASTTPRHGFRELGDRLNGFAIRFDRFRADNEPIEEERQSFSARCDYIRGIAALVMNQPEIAVRHLEQVVSIQKPEPSEDSIAHNRRIANSYYYLGVIESNFGRHQRAVEYFENANKRDLKGRDFLTKTVIAEEYVMTGDFDKAEALINEIERKVKEIKALDGSLPNYELRLWSRARLIRANMVIIKRGDQWEETVKTILQPVREDDANYYYATATLAQVHHLQGNIESAKQLFREVYDATVTLPDINIIKEIRSKILLLMLIGMSAKYIGLEKPSTEYLNRAHQHCADLPKFNSDTCTVFSLLSKKNENVEIIKNHIELIRKGVLLS